MAAESRGADEEENKALGGKRAEGEGEGARGKKPGVGADKEAKDEAEQETTDGRDHETTVEDEEADEMKDRVEEKEAKEEAETGVKGGAKEPRGTEDEGEVRIEEMGKEKEEVAEGAEPEVKGGRKGREEARGPAVGGGYEEEGERKTPEGKEEEAEGGNEEGAGEEKWGNEAEAATDDVSDDAGIPTKPEESKPPPPPTRISPKAPKANWGDDPGNATKRYKKRIRVSPPWDVPRTESFGSDKRWRWDRMESTSESPPIATPNSS